MKIDFPIPTLPFCSFSHEGSQRRLGVGVGTGVVDLEALQLSSIDRQLLLGGRLNPLLGAGRATWDALREELISTIADHVGSAIPQHEVTLHLAWDVGDYVDFYSSRYHAENVGRMFRPDAEPLLPNWLHLPVAYHGRAGTVVVDGTPIRRPWGQRRTPEGDVVFGPSTRLDIELELGFVVGGATALGCAIPIDEAQDHLFGLVLLNDWSARDIQAFEYVPLGPFLGKSFATSVSAWVVPMQALHQARVPGPTQTDPRPLEYLQTTDAWALDLNLKVDLRPVGSERFTKIIEVNASQALYWNAAQQLAHLTVNGARVRPGDLFGSGTVSGPEKSQSGSLLELTWSGRDPIEVDGSTRTFLEDGDEVVLRGVARVGEVEAPLGPVRGKILPS